MNYKKSTIKKFGEIEVGDYLKGTDNNPVQVVRVHEKHTPETMYELNFEGKTIEASGNHLWYVETDLDRNLHSTRIKESYKDLKNLTKDQKDDLYSIIESNLQKMEIDLSDMIDILDARNNNQRLKTLIRIAESIGHIAEENSIMEVLETGQQIHKNTVRIYDAKLFAEQILALSDKKFRKTHPIIKGRIVTTEELERLIPLGVHIPELD